MCDALLPLKRRARIAPERVVAKPTDPARPEPDAGQRDRQVTLRATKRPRVRRGVFQARSAGRPEQDHGLTQGHDVARGPSPWRASLAIAVIRATNHILFATRMTTIARLPVCQDRWPELPCRLGDATMSIGISISIPSHSGLAVGLPSIMGARQREHSVRHCATKHLRMRIVASTRVRNGVRNDLH